MPTYPSTATFPSEATFPSAEPISIIVGRVPRQPHQVTVVTPDGNRFRWAGDEPRAETAPQGLQFSSSMPGGSDQISLQLPRDPERSYPDVTRLSDLYVSRAGGRVAQYRLEETPRAQGERNIEISGRGGRAALEDRADVSALFVDRDLSRWQGMSLQRKAALYTTGTQLPSDGSATADTTTGAPGIAHLFEGAWAANRGPHIESWYDAGDGNLVGSVYATWTRKDSTTSNDFAWNIGIHDTDTGSGGSTSSDYQSEPTASDSELFTETGRWARLRFIWNSTAANAFDLTYGVIWTDIAVYGTHGLTKVGTPGGFYPGPMLEWLIQNHTALSVGTIDQGTFLHEHAAYLDPGTPLAIVEDLSRYEPLYDWFVYDNEFNFRRRGTYGKRWRARVAEANLQASGESVERLWNQVAVRVEDPYYGSVTVGPTGSAYDTTDDALIDSDPDNPANLRGVTRRALLDIGTGTIAGAIEVGRRFLEETKRLDNSGSATIEGLIQDDAGTWWPVDEIQAGDEISFTDSQDTSWRHIARVSYDDSSRTASLDIDAPPETLDALLSRLAATLVPLG